jgi:hypothetical protein
VQSLEELEHGGDYYGPVMGYTGDKPSVFFLLPHARDEGVRGSDRATHHVTSPPHVFTENEDGTLTITASILSHADAEGKGWHGYLTAGEWVTA